MYKCTKCHGSEVEQLAWIDLNTTEQQEGDVGEYYCRSCGAHTDVYFDNSNDLHDKDIDD
jgi:hypothetical protein